MIVDSHVLVWDPSRSTSEEPGAWLHHGAASMTADRLLREMAAAGVDAAVVIPPGWDPDGTETRRAVSRNPERFRRAARVPLNNPAAGSWVTAWQAGGDIVAVRASFWPTESRGWLEDGTAEWFWEAAAHSRIPVMCFAPHATPAIGAVALRYPDVRIAVDHLGLSVDLRGRSRAEAIDELVDLARYQNVAVKASALPDHAADGYPFASLHADIRRVVDAFGPGRVFWGSDLTRLGCTYREVVDLFREGLDLSTEDRNSILGEGIAAWLGWPPLTPETASPDRPATGQKRGISRLS